jgi:aerobic carbon-monoxide dehydrogenase medium subunit
MYPASFEYHAPDSLDEAIALLGQYGDDAKLISGGHSLLPLMKLRFAQPGQLIDLRKVPNLAYIREDAGVVRIGARTTHAMLERDTGLNSRLPIVAECAGHIGDPLVRNAGTIGGSLAHADPGADLPAAMLATGARMRAVGPGGARTIAAEEFFVDLLTSALRPDEVLTEIEIPVPAARTGGAYEKFPHPASRYALVGAAAVLTLGGTDTIAEARVALTGVGTKPVRATGVEQALRGVRLADDTLAGAAARAGQGLEARADLQGSAEYKAHLTTVQVRRALERAVERARSGG